jgi:hypothetical protein
MPLTTGERRVWASVYAQRLQDMREYPSGLYVPGNEDQVDVFEATCILGAIEAACHAVQHLREHASAVKEGFGEDNEVYLMLAEMIGESDD